VNRFVRGLGDDRLAGQALEGFRRFPIWMWRNTVVLDFVDWLRGLNARRPPPLRCGFYGLDMYSLHASIEGVLDYLDRAHPEVAPLARERYGCFARFGQDSSVYGMLTGLRGMEGCEDEAIAMLVELRRRAATAPPPGSPEQPAGPEDAFDAEQKNAEAYYRAMYLSDVSSWNLRDTHMAETLDALDGHLARQGRRPRIVVWAHNSHLGDARATEMGRERGELNLGQLMRERHGAAALLVGMTTHAGSVTAASDWGGPLECKRVLPSRSDSVEHVLHASGIPSFLLPLTAGSAQAEALQQPRLERAIGVIYRPETERQSHYFRVELSRQFDAVLHIDSTQALRALPGTATQQPAADLPETFPSGK
jgi:erythromycin esterase-like protein